MQYKPIDFQTKMDSKDAAIGLTGRVLCIIGIGDLENGYDCKINSL